jgi:hypothetical protein
MLAAYKSATCWELGIGLVIQGAGIICANSTLSGAEAISHAVLLMGAATFIRGCADYSRGKGYSPWLGLFGFISIIGLLIIAVLPDRHRNAPT